MRKTIAIAALAVRAALRSRLFITMMIVLLFVIVGLPLTIKGDGTASGLIKILLSYTLGLASVVQGAATLWVSCAAISHEIEDKQIQLIATKPVRRFQIWLGKWIGLLFMNATLLALSGVSVYLCVRHHADSPQLSEEDKLALRRELLVGRALIAAEPESAEAEARERLAQLAMEGKLPRDAHEREALDKIAKSLRVERSVVSPGQSKKWSFDVPASFSMTAKKPTAAGNEDAITIRFRLTSTIYERKPIAGTWIVSDAKGRETYRFEAKDVYPGDRSFAAPKSAIPAGPIALTFVNADSSHSNAAYFDSDAPVELLVAESSFESNLARSLVVILCQMGLIAAIGLTAGSLFSFPIASFTAAAVVIIAMAGHYFTIASSPKYAEKSHHHHHHNHAEEEKPSAFQIMSGAALKRLDVAIAPVIDSSPLGLLSDGLLVSWRLTARALLLLLGVYPAFFAFLGRYFLNRRELALPIG